MDKKVTVTKTTKVTTTTSGSTKKKKDEKSEEKKLPLQEKKDEKNGSVEKKPKAEKPKVEKKIPEKKPQLLSLMYKESAFMDFYMLAKTNGKTKSFPCHRVVLAAQSSPILRNYLVEEGAGGELQLGFNNNIVEKFVKYFYGEPITDDRMKDHFAAYMELANRFNLPEMKEQVEKEALKHINTDLNMVELYFKAEQFQAELVKTAAKTVIKKNKAKIQENKQALDKKLKKAQLSILLSILTE